MNKSLYCYRFHASQPQLSSRCCLFCAILKMHEWFILQIDSQLFSTWRRNPQEWQAKRSVSCGHLTHSENEGNNFVAWRTKGALFKNPRCNILRKLIFQHMLSVKADISLGMHAVRVAFSVYMKLKILAPRSQNFFMLNSA